MQKFSHIKKRIERKSAECDVNPDLSLLSNIPRMVELLTDVQRRVAKIEKDQTLVMERSKEVRRLEKIENNQETIILPILQNIGKTEEACTMGRKTVASR